MHNNPNDCRVLGAEMFLLPVETRVPLKFGAETLTSVTCCRIRIEVERRDGKTAEGWGETPLSVQWVWPSDLSYAERHEALIALCRKIAVALVERTDQWGHPMELVTDFQQASLEALITDTDIPHLAALLCLSAFDIALHDAYGVVHDRDVYQTYGVDYLNRDLAQFLEGEPGYEEAFVGKYPADFLNASPPQQLPVWHLVGGLDPIHPEELQGDEPDDGHPSLLADWIAADGLRCLKIKLRGNDAEWDYARIVDVGQIGRAGGVQWLTADFNCTVQAPAYVNAILDRLRDEQPEIYGQILYVEQPFPYDLEKEQIDTRSLSARKPLFLDESAHDWRFVRIGRRLGWSGVALKTCKTQTGALLSLCWAKAHGMPLMVQDLTNPMLAAIPHVRLAAHADTIMGVESNGMQFYPEASAAEAAVHPGIYRRRDGNLDISTLGGSGFGYRLPEIQRELPDSEGFGSALR